MPNWTGDRRAVALAGVVGLLVLGVLAGMLLLGDDPEPPPPPPAGPEPTSRPEPPMPVEGSLALDTVDLSHTDTRLFGESMSRSQPIPIKEDGAEAFAQLIVEWLDRHLTDLQEGGPGGAPDAGLAGANEILTLTHPQQPVDAARYHVVVYARGAPEWARTGVTVTREDGSTVRANVVFLPGDPPRLIAAQGEGEEPPPQHAGDAARRDEDGTRDAADADGDGDDRDATQGDGT